MTDFSKATPRWADEEMALHWIDRYSAGLDADPQMDRILECVEVVPADPEREKKVEALVSAAQQVMDALEEYGPSIVPHLMDTDQNAGQRLREAIASLKGGENG